MKYQFIIHIERSIRANGAALSETSDSRLRFFQPPSGLYVLPVQYEESGKINSTLNGFGYERQCELFPRIFDRKIIKKDSSFRAAVLPDASAVRRTRPPRLPVIHLKLI